LVAVTAAPASAQIWIGQIVGNMIAQGQQQAQEHACMMGTPQAQPEVDETRSPTAELMSRYWDAARKGPVDLAPFYHESGKKRWTAGKTTVGPNKFGKVTDPLATTAGLTLEPQPVGFLRSGDGATVQGQWRVLAPDGSEAGRLDASFTRQIGVWRLRTLHVLHVGEAVPAVAAFCHKPGDIEPYKVAFAEQERLRAEKRARKEAARAARERARQTQASTR
jgi:hypothetical protein